MRLIGRHLSFCLNGQLVELVASPGETLRACFSRQEGHHTLLVSSFSDSTQEHAPVPFLTYDGRGWTWDVGSCTAESQAPPTAKQSEGRPLSSDAELAPTSRDGTCWTDWEPQPPLTSSTTTEPKSQSSGGLGQRLVNVRRSVRRPMIFDVLEQPSSCHED
jgi:hypothetical protein